MPGTYAAHVAEPSRLRVSRACAREFRMERVRGLCDVNSVAAAPGHLAAELRFYAKETALLDEYSQVLPT